MQRLIRWKLIGHYLGLLALCSLAGFLSGILYPDTMGLRGAVLGCGLALGIVVINTVSELTGRAEKTPPWWWVIIVVFGLGLLVGFVLSGKYFTRPMRGEFHALMASPGLPTIIVSLCYSVLLLGLYFLRRSSSAARSFRLLLPLSIYVCAVAMQGADRSAYNQPAGDLGAYLIEGLIYSLFSSLPFTVLWWLAARLCDPMWSQERWQRLLRTKENGVSALHTES